MCLLMLVSLTIFQSTLPCGSDLNLRFCHITQRDFNPRSLAGATGIVVILPVCSSFQSTLPCGSDEYHHGRLFHTNAISIHAPLRERPITSTISTNGKSNFNPRSLAGATWAYQQQNAHQFISIHAPLRERQLIMIRCVSCAHHFNPRSLAGATTADYTSAKQSNISIHAPLRERHSLLSTLLI